MTRESRTPRGSGPGIVLLAFFVVALALPGLGLTEGDRPEGYATVGRGVFQSYCTSCHGPEAHGDGPVAEHLKIPPADLTKLHERYEGGFDGDIVFRAILGDKSVRAHGNSEMPIWGDAFQKVVAGQTDEEILQKVADLVAYLESIQE